MPKSHKRHVTPLLIPVCLMALHGCISATIVQPTLNANATVNTEANAAVAVNAVAPVPTDSAPTMEGDRWAGVVVSARVQGPGVTAMQVDGLPAGATVQWGVTAGRLATSTGPLVLWSMPSELGFTQATALVTLRDGAQKTFLGTLTPRPAGASPVVGDALPVQVTVASPSPTPTSTPGTATSQTQTCEGLLAADRELKAKIESRFTGERQKLSDDQASRGQLGGVQAYVQMKSLVDQQRQQYLNETFISTSELKKYGCPTGRGIEFPNVPVVLPTPEPGVPVPPPTFPSPIPTP